MSKILEAIDKLAKQTYPPGWNNPAIRKFIETGDEGLLKGIPSFQYSWAGGLVDALPDPDAWTDEASRVLGLAHAKGLRSLLENWLRRYCRYQSANWQHFDAAVKQLKSVVLSDAEVRDLLMECDVWDSQAQKPTPAAELVLQGADAEIIAGIMQKYDAQWQLPALLAHSQPDRLERLMAGGLKFRNVSATYEKIVLANPGRFAAKAFAVFEKLQAPRERIDLIVTLAETVPGKYMDPACAEVSAYLRQDVIPEDYLGRFCAEFMLKHGLPDALELTCKWMAGFAGMGRWDGPHQRALVITSALEKAPRLVLPMAEACARCPAGNVALLGLKYWKQQGIGDAADRYHEAVKRLLANADASAVVSAIAEAREWDIQRTKEDIWPLMLHKSRPVRGAAARALACMGYAESGERAAKLLEHKKADIRQAAVLLLSQIGGDEAARILKQHLDIEENDDARDSILLTLEASGSGAALSPAEQRERIAKTLAKSKSPPSPWIKADALVFKKRDGGALTTDETLYLLIRQSRCKEMRADLEAKPIITTLDRKGSADAALTLIQGFLGTAQDASDRWVLALAALTGDDRLVPVLRKAILDWADKSRGKLAEYGAQALALLGTEAALMVVDSLSVRFRSKNKNIGQAAADAFAAAAEARGVTVEELGDLVVPWLGFEPGKPRLIDAGKSQVEARIDAELKLGFRDVKTGKTMSKLPSGVSAEVQAEFKTLAGTLKEAVKAQLLRIEILLVRQFRWPVARWRGLYLAHPLLRPFTQQLVWGWRDADGKLRHTFRALDDASLTDAQDNAVALPDEGTISLVHPLDLTDEARAAWLQHLADYEIAPPFPQLDRPVVRVKPEDAGLKFGRHVQGTDLNAMTFRSRAEKLGWSRGSVCDAGAVTAYRKVFSGAGIEAFLSLEGMYVGIGMEESIQLGDVCFVKAGSVKVGSYTYDEPGKDDDPRLIAFGDVPAVPFSEVMGDLAKIAGTSTKSETETD
jgi:hypothetical protein